MWQELFWLVSGRIYHITPIAHQQVAMHQKPPRGQSHLTQLSRSIKPKFYVKILYPSDSSTIVEHNVELGSYEEFTEADVPPHCLSTFALHQY